MNGKGMASCVATLLAVALLAAGCGRSAPKKFTGQGKLLEIDPAHKTVKIQHQDIPGLMPGMTMTFPVADVAVLAEARPGDTVEFVLLQGRAGLTVVSMKRVALGLPPPPERPQSFTGHGTVVLVNRKVDAVVLRHEGIGDAIPPGELVLGVEPPALLNGIEDNTEVDFTVTELPDRLVITGLRKVAKKK